MTLAVLKLGYMLERPCSREIEELKNLELLLSEK